MQSVGAVWVMVDLKGSSSEIALVQTATTLPVVCFGIIGGALADLSDRRRVLFVTQTMMLVAAGSYPSPYSRCVVTNSGKGRERGGNRQHHAAGVLRAGGARTCVRRGASEQ